MWYEGRSLTETFAQMMSVWYDGDDALNPDGKGGKTPYLDRFGGFATRFMPKLFQAAYGRMVRRTWTAMRRQNH